MNGAPRPQRQAAGTLPDLHAEWLEPDGLGGFASGTVGGERRRRYHGVLLTALTPPTGRTLLVSGYDAWIERPGPEPGQPEYLTVQRYAPGVLSRPGDHLVSFRQAPWPTWSYRLSDGTRIEHELLVPDGHAMVVLRWRLARPGAAAELLVRPFLSGRDIHALHHENPDFRFEADSGSERVGWQPYPSFPAVLGVHNGTYQHAPAWYRSFDLEEERARGFDHVEDAGSPGVLRFDLSRGEAVLILAAGGHPGSALLATEPPAALAERLRRHERIRRRQAGSLADRAGRDYLVRRGDGSTIIAGYPWFTDWGRDTFIALRGLCLAAGRLDDARSILRQWAGSVSEGMLPNRFVDEGGAPEYNSVDASLWYVIAVGELLEACRAARRALPAEERRALDGAVQAILDGYARGTRYGIGSDDDGLLRAGVPGVQLTWMDAKIGDWVVTPRIGKPVEIQALWINALRVGARLDPRWLGLANRARNSFAARFWNEERRCLFDVVDADGVAGRNDPSLRPNQIFAVGGLPHPILEGERAAQVVATVERELLTPLGLRSLGRGEPGYRGRYQGGPLERDASYHQGTVWPWLTTAFVEAWLRVHGADPARRLAARRRFLDPLLAHLDEAGLGHVSEIADAEPPHTPRGCPFQAWSVGELLRLERLLAETVTPPPSRRHRRRVQPA